jgi:hypothetical protein
MIHFMPEFDGSTATMPNDAMARVAGLSHALAAAETLVGGTGLAAEQTAIAAAWPTATDAQHALFDALSANAVAGSVAGLEAIATLRDAGLEANRAAIDTLTTSIRGEIDRLGLLLTL